MIAAPFDMLEKVSIGDPNIAGYLNMLNDRWRNEFFYRALEKHAQDRVVLDIGTGTGILAFYALRHGARFVYCIERSNAMVRIADQVLSQHFDRSRFQVIKADFWTNEIDGKITRPIDLLVSETVGPGLFDQGMLHTWTSAQPFLSPDAMSIPDCLHCDIWLWDQEIGPMTAFMPAETLDQDFAKALIDADRTRPLLYWLEINRLSQTPLTKISDVINYTRHSMPPIEFSDQEYPMHILPNIEFNAEIPAGTTLSIINKISFEDQTLYLKDAKYMPWRWAPSFFFENSGTYNFKYQNLRLEHMCPVEWIYKNI